MSTRLQENIELNKRAAPFQNENDCALLIAGRMLLIYATLVLDVTRTIEHKQQSFRFKMPEPLALGHRLM
jgi:hypothetical protein